MPTYPYFSDSFETRTGWEVSDNAWFEAKQALGVSNLSSQAYALAPVEALFDASLSVRLQLAVNDASAGLVLRDSAEGRYWVTVSMDGWLKVYRNAELLGAKNVTIQANPTLKVAIYCMTPSQRPPKKGFDIATR